MKITGIALAAIAASALAAQGCIVDPHHHHWGGATEPAVAKRAGPPPHAPAHGYRHKQHDRSGSQLSLRFDTDLGVYVVLGQPDHYWSNDRYFRWSGAHWEVSTELGHGWSIVVNGAVPPRLAAKHAHHKPHHKKWKHVPAKRGH